MKRDIKKQDKILSSIGLKREMVYPYLGSVNDETQFKRYVPEYMNSRLREMDEVYRMNGFNLLHIHSGLRLSLSTHESYDGETVNYTVVRMFIKTLNGEELEVLDANFKDEIFYTSNLEIPFSQTYFTKEELEWVLQMKMKEDRMTTEEMNKAAIDLMFGRRKPKNKFEERLLKQIKEIESKGGIVDLPSE